MKKTAHIVRWIFVFCVLLLEMHGVMLRARAEEGTETGTIGTNGGITWVYDTETKTLTLSGKDELHEICTYDEEEVFSPFYEICEEKDVEKISFESCRLTGSAAGLFSDLNVKTIDFSGLDTGEVTDMASMFSGCVSLSSLDLSPMDTSKVTNMASMFSACDSLSSLDLSGMDTSNVTNMSNMFRGCSKLESLNLSGMDTSKVTDMASMFFSAGV